MELMVACFITEWMSVVANWVIAVTAVIALIFAMKELKGKRFLESRNDKKKSIRKLLKEDTRCIPADTIFEEYQKTNKLPRIKSIDELESLLDEMEDEQSIGIAVSNGKKCYMGFRVEYP